MPTNSTFVRSAFVLSLLACVACSTNPSSEEDESVDAAENAVGTSDPFESTYCSGAPIDESQAKARFAPGATHVELGEFDVEARRRSCNVVTGCTPWVRVTTELLYTIEHKLDYRTWRETWRMPRTHRGTIAFDVVGDQLRLTLTSDPITYEDQYGSRSAVVEYRTPLAGDPTGHPIATLKVCDAGGPACNYNVYPGKAFPGFTEDGGGIVTTSCVRRLVQFRDDALRDGSAWTDYEYVWYGRYK